MVALRTHQHSAAAFRPLRSPPRSVRRQPGDRLSAVRHVRRVLHPNDCNDRHLLPHLHGVVKTGRRRGPIQASCHCFVKIQSSRSYQRPEHTVIEKAFPGLETLTFDLVGHGTCRWCGPSCSVYVPSLKFVGLPIRKMLGIYCVNINRSGDLDLWPGLV